jgi:hypothetical protein
LDDQTINSICAEIPSSEGGLKRPDLMYESFITSKGKMKTIFNMTEITSPWAFGDSLHQAYEFKKRKYEPVQLRFHERSPTHYDEVRLNVIVVSPSGVFPMESQREFAIATGLSRGDLAAHTRFVVDAAISSAFEHYGTYCKAMGYSENVRGARSMYTPLELEFQEELKEMEIVDSIRDVEAVEHPAEGPTHVQIEPDISAMELRRASEIEQEVRGQTGKLVAQKNLDSAILQAHGIEHAAGCLGDAGHGVARARGKRESLDDNAAKALQIAVRHELQAVAECAGSGENGVFQFQGG